MSSNNLSLWSFHRGLGDSFRALGTDEQARKYLRHLNAGRVDHLYSARKAEQQLKAIDLAAELATLAAQEKTK